MDVFTYKSMSSYFFYPTKCVHRKLFSCILGIPTRNTSIESHWLLCSQSGLSKLIKGTLRE